MHKEMSILCVQSFLRECLSEKLQNFLLRSASFSFKDFFASELFKEEQGKKRESTDSIQD